MFGPSAMTHSELDAHETGPKKSLPPSGLPGATSVATQAALPPVGFVETNTLGEATMTQNVVEGQEIELALGWEPSWLVVQALAPPSGFVEVFTRSWP